MLPVRLVSENVDAQNGTVQRESVLGNMATCAYILALFRNEMFHKPGGDGLHHITLHPNIVGCNPLDSIKSKIPFKSY
jgi:hypothetical protein